MSGICSSVIPLLQLISTTWANKLKEPLKKGSELTEVSKIIFLPQFKKLV